MHEKKRFLAIYLKNVKGELKLHSKVVEGIDRIRALDMFSKKEEVPTNMIEKDSKIEGIVKFDYFNNDVNYV